MIHLVFPGMPAVGGLFPMTHLTAPKRHPATRPDAPTGKLPAKTGLLRSWRQSFPSERGASRALIPSSKAMRLTQASLINRESAMLPLIINNKLERLVQITMGGSVGLAGKNVKNDVTLVQTLLNACTPGEGGPQTKLVVDGLSGPLTAGAIRRYQQSKGLIADGRVDVLGPTIKSLGNLLNDRNGLPKNLAGIDAPDPKMASLLRGQISQSSIKSKAELAPASAKQHKGFSGGGGGVALAKNPWGYTGPIDWDYVTSRSIDVSVGPLGAIGLEITLKCDDIPDRPSVEYYYMFVGQGAGLSLLPAGLDYATRNFASSGSRLCKPNPFAGKAPPVWPNDLLLPTTVISFGGNQVDFMGSSYAVVLWGAWGSNPGFTRYANTMAGVQTGTPNFGLTVYTGNMERWR